MRHSSFPLPLAAPMTAAAVVEKVGRPVREVLGDAGSVVTAVAALDDAGPGCLTFCRHEGEKGLQAVAASTATVIVVGEAFPVGAGRCHVVVDRPKGWFVAATAALFPPPGPADVHSSAYIGAGVTLGEGVAIGPHASVEDGAHIGEGTVVGPGSRIARRTVIGRHCVIGANCALGFPGLGTAREDDESLTSFPHLGAVVVGDRVEMGSGCVIARGILKDTYLADGVKLGNLVNIGHNCDIGADSWISSGAIVAGSVRLGRRVQIGTAAVVRNQVSMGDDSQVGVAGVVMKDVKEGGIVFGYPARPIPSLFRFEG